MAPNPLPTPATPSDDGYAAACAVWQSALDQYLRLAREGATAAKLRAAAAAVHAAALRKGRLAPVQEHRER